MGVLFCIEMGSGFGYCAEFSKIQPNTSENSLKRIYGENIKIYGKESEYRN